MGAPMQRIWRRFRINRRTLRGGTQLANINLLEQHQMSDIWEGVSMAFALVTEA